MLRRHNDLAELIGTSAAVAQVRALIDRVAGSSATVLVTGPSGSGKEVVAQLLHQRGARAARPFVAVNCGAVPAELIESEIFGHEAGAFTGASKARRGRFELADTGTLFLDEVGDMPAAMQVKLLRVLETRVVERVGGMIGTPVDVRVVAATNVDLAAAVAAGRFREDLYYRLAVVEIALPPLADRREDITARISGMGQVSSAVDALVSAMASRTRNGALGPLPASTDSAVFTARATAGAKRTLQPTSIEVRALAAGQSLVSPALAGRSATVGQGMLTITLGTSTPDGQGGFGFAGGAAGIDVVIGPGDDSLTGLAAAINRATTGVRASIVDDGQGSRLVLKGPTGAKSAFILTATGDTGLDRFLYNPATAAMTSAGTARDAALAVDGVPVTRSSNTITDLVAGVSLDLVKAVPGAPATLFASRDTVGIAQAVGDLVDAVNALHSLTATLTKGGSDDTTAGALAGDAVLRQTQRQLAKLTGSGGLATLGVRTARDGTLSVDTARLSAALVSDPDGAEATLAGLTATGGALTRLKATLPAGADPRLAREQKAVATGKTVLENSSATLRTQLTRQFAAMESAVAASKSTQSFLDQQIKAWNRTDS